MGGSIFRAIIALIVICTPVVLAAAADADASDMTVTGIQISPSVLMRGDTATATISVENRGGTSVAVRRAYPDGGGDHGPGPERSLRDRGGYRGR